MNHGLVFIVIFVVIVVGLSLIAQMNTARWWVADRLQDIDGWLAGWAPEWVWRPFTRLVSWLAWDTE